MNISSYLYNIGFICKNPIQVDEVVQSSQFNDFLVNTGIFLGFFVLYFLIILGLYYLIINLIK